MARYKTKNNTPLSERLDHYSIPVTECGCVVWIGSVNSDGYGKIRPGGNRKAEFAHRMSWQLVNGKIPDGMCVLHRCDIPSCINPDHLFLGTQLENMADMEAKNRGGISRKLNKSDVFEIKKAAGSQREIARRFGVCQRTVNLIKRGLIWSRYSENGGADAAQIRI